MARDQHTQGRKKGKSESRKLKEVRKQELAAEVARRGTISLESAKSTMSRSFLIKVCSSCV